ncbi:capsule biosynthesis protein [Burkholderia sp. WSM2230]|uniref:capsule biosynthesis protein n=1 Tax=Burkholderia sp. WSM2230 TaxID=944435 RepID=UPI000426F483|nr:capsular biosynthesis protein [Burkholderia sp. WSM2230]
MSANLRAMRVATNTRQADFRDNVLLSGGPCARRSFLALQGTASPFFAELGRALVARGHDFTRVNFCGGDLAYANVGQQVNFAGHAQELPGWYASAISRHGVTDVVLFGDCRAIHWPMHAVAQAEGCRVHVFEEGYVRPWWVTLERTGVNGRSEMPRDAQWYLDRREETPPCPTGVQTPYNLFERAYHDIRYRAANALYARRFPHYASHRPRNGLVEYAGLARRAALSRVHAQHANKVIKDLLASGDDYYVFPLQLNSDSQIVVHSPFEGIRDVIDRVMRSFAAHAPARSILVIKNHPLDTGLIDYRRMAQQLARELGIENRLRFIDSGHLPTLLDNARGAVVVNSTVGLSALHHALPLMTLGTAIYSMAGLTWQGTLEAFWHDAAPPDMALYRAFLDYVVHHTQINGDFYTRTGIDMATTGAVRRLEAVAHA